MISNNIYRQALERVIPEILINDGKVLITGASGLIGSCIIDLLMLSNEFGRHFDVYALGRNTEKLKKRFVAFLQSPHLNFVEQDICNPLDNSISYDYIIHGASNADPRNYALYPVETMLTNFDGARNVLNYCKDHHNTKVLMMSTFEVYGYVGKDVYGESDSGVVELNMIRSCYPESKRCMEILTRCFVDEYGVKAIIGRLSSVYGPTMAKDDSKAHAQFIKNGLNGENIVLKSKGEQKRTYCYVIDAITGLLYVLAKGNIGEAYNVSNEKSVVSIAELAQKVADLSGSEVTYEVPDELELKGYSKPQNCILDNSKLKSLGWRGCYSLHDGIKQCLSILKGEEQRL
jgi:nucleoside-diphosphate-sugar epimerase